MIEQSLIKMIEQCPSVTLEPSAADYPVFEIRNQSARARISLHGAQVLEFTPANETPVLWLSTQAIYKAGSPIRGGVPICWPWFGNHPDNPELPAHGFVRNRFWTLAAVTESSNDLTQLEFETQSDDASRKLWPHDFELRLHVSVGKSLALQLIARNTGQRPWTMGAALHSYFSIGEITETQIESVTGLSYLDKPDGFQRKQQTTSLEFSGEVDRVYQAYPGNTVVDDRAQTRQINIEKTGSQTTVIWNPWQQIAASMKDMEDDAYRRFVCVEPANAFDDQITLAPGESHELGMSVSLVG